MNKLLKPQKQCYTGEDSKVVAYSIACEIARYATICTVVAGIGTLLTWSPFLGATTVVCAVAYVVSSATCRGYI